MTENTPLESPPQSATQAEHSLLLLREAVLAKLRYWDALASLEKALSPNADLSDRQSDRLTDAVDNLAAAFPGDPQSDPSASAVTPADLNSLLERLKL